MMLVPDCPGLLFWDDADRKRHFRIKIARSCNQRRAIHRVKPAICLNHRDRTDEVWGVEEHSRTKLVVLTAMPALVDGFIQREFPRKRDEVVARSAGAKVCTQLT